MGTNLRRRTQDHAQDAALWPGVVGATPSSPFSQARPDQPSGHVQWPEAGSQLPPFWQRQACWQLWPYWPAGQAGMGEGGSYNVQPEHPGLRRLPHPHQPKSRPKMGTSTHPSPVRTPSLGGTTLMQPPFSLPQGPRASGSEQAHPSLDASTPHPQALGGSIRGAHSRDSCAGLTLQAGGPHPAGGTVALPVDRVTGGPVEAGAGLAAVQAVREGWASCQGEGQSGLRGHQKAVGRGPQALGGLGNAPSGLGHPPKLVLMSKAML